ncbi:ABC transporter permease [Clostridium sp. DJ247]|uniref:ABC transporter permease n=1 Tax=Clostridium sp. DJ247 TaxID=2726188 RepID=UPI0016277FE8|nr:ABC transporter permease [Clostridium sp. DJ247]MBC2582636.1 ABC transporter permease [Clostridium sp. DJ247]
MIKYITNNYNEILKLFLQHIELTVVSLAIALIIALPLGVLLSKFKKLSSIGLSLLGIIYTIPSLAFFAILIPIVGLGKTPAIIALVAYSQLILVRNIMVGFKSIDPAVIEAGKGMGLDPFQLFFEIELVVAMPVILGGIRIAAISIIGIGTIAAWINAGGLGVMLFQGLYQDHAPKIICGTVLVSLLSVITNYFLLFLEKRAHLKVNGEL